jgi:hypothetical protein
MVILAVLILQVGRNKEADTNHNYFMEGSGKCRLTIPVAFNVT